MKRLLVAIFILVLSTPAAALAMLFASTAFADCPGMSNAELAACEHIQWASAGAVLVIGSVITALLIRAAFLGIK